MDLCKICSEITKGTYFNAETSYIKDMLDSVVPEMNTTPNDVMCHSCYVYLEKISNFRLMCLENETKVVHYIQNCTDSSRGPVDLVDIVEYKQNKCKTRKKPTTTSDKVKNHDGYVVHPDGTIEQLVCYDVGEKKHKVDSCKKTIDKKRRYTRKHKTRAPDIVKNNELHDGYVIHPDGMIKQMVCFNGNEEKHKVDSPNHKRTNANAIVSNKRKSSQPDLRVFPCPSCAKVFKKQTTYEKHITKCQGTKKYRCQLCNKSFVSTGHLKRHQQCHTGEKPHVCKVCDKGFSEKSALHRHQLTHSKDRPFKCDICHKCFVQRGHLSSHLLTHTGEKGYKCEICSKAFRHKCSFKTHLRLHTGEAPYRCESCNMSFRDGSCYRRHLQRRTHFNKF